MAEYGLLRPFQIDNGELDGVSKAQAFTLGYELATIDRLLELPEAISRPVNADNRERIETVCRESGRRYQLVWSGDESEAWMQLDVAPRDS